MNMRGTSFLSGIESSSKVQRLKRYECLAKETVPLSPKVDSFVQAYTDRWFARFVRVHKRLASGEGETVASYYFLVKSGTIVNAGNEIATDYRARYYRSEHYDPLR